MRNLVHTLLILFLLTSVSVNGALISNSNDLEVNKDDLTIIVHKVDHTSNDNNNGKIEFEIKGGTGIYTLKLMGPGTRNMSPDPSKKIILENLGKGTYTIAVEDDTFNFSYKSIEVK